MDIKVNGPGGVRGTDKSKNAKRAGSATGPSFAELLDQAGAVSAPETPAPTLPTAPYVPLPDEPATARRQARELLDSLTSAADAALGGEPVRALADLQAALQQSPHDRDSLNADQKQALDELATRAAVEVAKRQV
jgi:hypothetical protein